MQLITMQLIISRALLLISLLLLLSSDALLFSKNQQKHYCAAQRPFLDTTYSSSLSATTSSQSTVDRKGKDATSSGKKIIATHRSTAVFALMESSRKKGLFAIRKLEGDPNYLNLETRDRAFGRLLLTTVERRQGQIDKVIEAFMHKSKPKSQKKKPVDMLIEATLRIGAAQLLFLTDVPAYAVLKETVDVLRMHPKIKVGKPNISFVNAVLRSIDRDGQEILVSKTSVYDNVEPWLVKEWIDAYGEAKTEMIVEASMHQSPIFLSVNNAQGSVEEDQRQKKLDHVAEVLNATVLPHGSLKMSEGMKVGVNGMVSSWPMYEEGEWWVQDASAALPAIALSNVLGGEKDKDQRIAKGQLHVVDLCSAPGGKTAQLCSLGFGRVTAVEFSARRSKALQDNLKRLKMTEICTVKVADGREWKPDDGSKIHGVLVDAPCSATGVGSRRPDVLRKSPDLEELTSVQRELTAHAADELLEPGGILVYATCSLLKQESEDQMNWLLSRTEGADVETIPFVPGEIPGFDDAIDENGWLRVLPGVLPGALSACDGFFVGRFRRL